MTMLSPHFSLSEALLSQTATRMGITNEPDADTLPNMVAAAAGMEQVRAILGYSIRVNSWLRTLRLNRAVGSRDSSSHVTGWAIDFICPSYGSPIEICKTIAASGIGFDQLINEQGWVHISFSPAYRMEVLTATFVNGKATYSKGL